MILTIVESGAFKKRIVLARLNFRDAAASHKRNFKMSFNKLYLTKLLVYGTVSSSADFNMYTRTDSTLAQAGTNSIIIYK
jgi:hypothetical protein